MRRRTRYYGIRLLFALFLTMTLLSGPVTSPQGASAAAVKIPSDKMDRSFLQELATDDGNKYYDVVVVFENKGDTALLDRFSRGVKRFRELPMARILLNKEEIAEVTGWPQVLFVEPNRKMKLFNQEGRQLTRAEQVQQLGYKGSGVEVAVIDTGADGTHPDLDDNLVHNWEVVGDFLGGAGYVSSTPDGIDVQTELVSADDGTGVAINTDEYGHGTHVSGTIAGTGEASGGKYRGMAPEAKIHSYSTSAGLFLVFTLEAYDHIIHQVHTGAADIRIVSNSWGSDGCEFEPNDPTNLATRMAYEYGILSVFAYGNSGPAPNTCNPYATAPYVLGVAATDKSYKVTGFSSRGREEGPFDREAALKNLSAYLNASKEDRQNWDFAANPLGIFRPSVAAPGQDIVSAQNPVHPMTASGTPYGAASGTSMATPHVSGIAALIIEAYEKNHPGKKLRPIDLIRLIEVTANKDVMVGYDTHDTGAGFVDAYAAVKRAERGKIPSAVTDRHLVSYDPGPTVTESGTYSGTVLANSFQTNVGYGVHEVEVKEGALKIYADVSWASELEKVYISLYAPGDDVEKDPPVARSAGLLDMTNKRFIEFKFPWPGIWKVRIDGRVNTATPYEGKWEVHYPDKDK